MSEGRDDTLANIGISPRERLGNIELALARIETKLDSKANQSDVDLLNARVRELELGDGPNAREMRVRVEHLDGEVKTVGRKLAYATGTLAAVMVAINLVVPVLIQK